MIALSFALAALTYRFVERPIRAKRASRVAPFLGAGCLPVAFAGLVTFQAGGFAGRFPPELRDLAYYKTNYRYNAAKLWREGICYLTSPMTAARFSAACVDATPQNAPLVLLWGDSHAAALYPGFAELNRQSLIRVAQFTRAGCRPYLTLAAKTECDNTNAFVLRRIETLHPDFVVIHANWMMQDFDVEKVAEAVRAVKRLVPNVLVIGPAPHWSDSLPQLMIRQIQHGLSPARLSDGRGADVVRTETALSDMARANGVWFFSMTDILCEQASCLTHVGPGNAELTAFDSSHITSQTAGLIAQRLSKLFVRMK
jgi:hypothetical protein